MAKTKQDYIVEGAKLFKGYKSRPEGNSWQVKAMQNGWDAEDKIFQKEDNQKKVIHPALMHINFLIEKSNKTKDAVISARYYVKASNLQYKWFKRGVMF